MEYAQTIHAGNVEFRFTVQVDDGVDLTLDLTSEALGHLPDSALLRLALHSSGGSFAIRRLAVEWTIPIVDMHGLYLAGNPRWEMAHLPFWQMEKQVAANTGVPYLALFHRSGSNRFAFGAFDQVTETTFTAELSEITRCYHFRLEKPANHAANGQTIPTARTYEEQFFVSTASGSWSNVLHQYVELHDRMQAVNTMPVPDAAYAPVFCSWTAIHHDVSHEWIMRNATVAADLGFGTWITDDGWFIETGKFADYSHVGEWMPSRAKFLDFAEHVRMVQALGLKYILWVAPFMIGYDSEAAKQYAHLLTTGREPIRFHNLSPWHEETRDIVTALLRRLVTDYALDGLKIDFIDSVIINSTRIEGASDETLGSRVDAILDEAIRHLRDQNPDILVEFRNTYSNLASRRYANIYRCSDVPLNPVMNRWQACLLRLLVPDRAVHLDPALWHPEDTDENVAVHLINLLVGVPMVSIELDKYPRSHLDLIRYWIGFYNAHRRTFIRGGFQPVIWGASIPSVYFYGEDEKIVILYDDVDVNLTDGWETGWVLNASSRPIVHFSAETLTGTFRVQTYDKFGAQTADDMIRFPAANLPVEVGGSLMISRNADAG